MEWKTITQILGLVGLIGGGSYWTWKNIVKPCLAFVKRFEEIGKGFDKLAGMVDRSNYIDKKVDALVYLSDHAFFVCNKDGLCILANEALCNLFGAKENQMKGFGWLNFLHPDDKEKALHIWEQAIHNGGTDLKTNYRIIHGETEETITATYHAIISRDDDGEVIVSVGRAIKKPTL